MLLDIDALEQFPCQKTRRRRTEEIGGGQSDHTRYPENHGLHLDALVSDQAHWRGLARAAGCAAPRLSKNCPSPAGRLRLLPRGDDLERFGAGDPSLDC